MSKPAPRDYCDVATLAPRDVPGFIEEVYQIIYKQKDLDTFRICFEDAVTLIAAYDRLAEENKILREAIENMQGILSPNRKGHHAMGCETRAIDVGFTALARVEGLE